MNFCAACDSDIGIKKETNQDSLLLARAQRGRDDEIVLAVICDGVGGLKMGELASAAVVWAFRDWFDERMPVLCREENPRDDIFDEWDELVQKIHTTLKDSSEKEGFRLGTTVEALLLLGGRYYICHVGDCRVYSFGDGPAKQLTVDHSVVQQEIDAGRLTPQQARKDPRQNLLLQCVGAGNAVKPDFLSGTIRPGQQFLLCCDGFRRRVTEAEIEKNCHVPCKEDKMQEALEKNTELCKKRGEHDNITSILVGSVKPGLFHFLHKSKGCGGYCKLSETLLEHTKRNGSEG